MRVRYHSMLIAARSRLRVLQMQSCVGHAWIRRSLSAVSWRVPTHHVSVRWRRIVSRGQPISPYTQPTIVAPYAPNSRAAAAQRAAMAGPAGATAAAGTGDASDDATPRYNTNAKADPIGGLVVSELPHPSCRITLCGSLDHRGSASSTQIVAHIRSARPESVFVEIPEGRLADLSNWIRKYNKMKARGEFASKYDMAEAIDAALQINSTVYCGDLPEPVQHARLVHNFSFVDVLRSVYEQRLWRSTKKGLLFRFGRLYGVEQTKRVYNELSAFERVPESEVTSHFRRCRNRMQLDDRDTYMAYNLHKLSLRTKSIVALVGAAHVPGITQRWHKYGLHQIIPPELAVGTASATAATASPVRPITRVHLPADDHASPSDPASLSAGVDASGPTSFVADTTQAGVHTGLLRDAIGVLTTGSDDGGSGGGLSGWAAAPKRRAIVYLTKHAPHPNPEWLQRELERYPWKTPNSNQTPPAAATPKPK